MRVSETILILSAALFAAIALALAGAKLVQGAAPSHSPRIVKVILSTVGVAALLAALFLPSAYALLAGYKIQELKVEGDRLGAEAEAIKLQEAQLLSPERLEQLAREQLLGSEKQKVIYLDGSPAGLASVVPGHSGIRLHRFDDRELRAISGVLH